jgi:hypothetical protein
MEKEQVCTQVSKELTEAERKELTEYLGECFHDENIAKDRLGYSFAICEKCGANRAAVTFRTFDTPADLHAVYSMIHRLHKWANFIDFAMRYWSISKHEHSRDDFMAWLFCLNCPGEIPEMMKMVLEFERWKQ